MASRVSILERVIGAAKGDLSAALATYLLAFDFPSADQARYAELSSNAQDGSLSAEERAELEDFLDVNDFLTILQSKARAALGRQSSAA